MCNSYKNQLQSEVYVSEVALCFIVSSCSKACYIWLVLLSAVCCCPLFGGVGVYCSVMVRLASSSNVVILS